MSQNRAFFDHLLLPDGWQQNVTLTIAADGTVETVECDSAPQSTPHYGVAMPGILNAHSHAFQRAMAGLAEYRMADKDSFWTWRDVMYRFAASITPDDLQAIAAFLHVELLKQGFTSLAEFHYVHHDETGKFYSPIAAMSYAVINAARLSGIGLTHLPTLYMTAGFDSAPLSDRQKRFENSLDSYFDIIRALDKAVVNDPNIHIGTAAHSLRAVPHRELQLLRTSLKQSKGPFHIHIAEQMGEVDDCLKHTNQRPIAWLLDHCDVDAQWTLVHATHMDDSELKTLAETGATVAICPTTEANLGDGIFRTIDFLGQNGSIAIGTDSHVSVSPWEEMRWLDYTQRLLQQSRNPLASEAFPHSGRAILNHVQQSAAHVSGRKIGKLQPGWRADIIVFDTDNPHLHGRSPDQIIDAAIFAGLDRPIRHVMVGGQWIIENGQHKNDDLIAAAYLNTLKRINKHQIKYS